MKYLKPKSEDLIEAGEDLETMTPAEKKRKLQHEAFMSRIFERDEKFSHALP